MFFVSKGFLVSAVVVLLAVHEAGASSPFHFQFVKVIAANNTGNLRDPSSALQDKDGIWHFWTDYMPGNIKPGWGAYLHHYHAESIEGPWTFSDLAFDHDKDPHAWGSYGSFSSSVIYDDADASWYIFYTATATANYSSDMTCAQLVAKAASPYGPWTQLGPAAQPTGQPPAWNQGWNARRLDSGRVMIMNGTRAYFTKGVRNQNYAQEGVYLPASPNSFEPPYHEYANNPIYLANHSSDLKEGYENCEFFAAPNGTMHVLCNSHTKGQPLWQCATPDCMSWTRIGDVDTAPALEPTPVYEGVPGDQALVRYFIARMNAKVEGDERIVIGLFNITWT